MTILDRLNAALADRYTVERELGSGGMATVYLAEDIKHHRKVAIKVLREDLAASMGAARFLREIEIAAQLQHPNILPLLDSGDADGLLYYVMPYVAGQSLRERIDKEGELPVHEAARLIGEVVDALVEAHAHGVVHRDIKPDNVMLSGRHALVADFGVAKAISEATGRNTVTTLGVAVGTPAYMSPEQAAADPHIDHRSDIYAVGALAYELLTGRPPFVGATPQQVLAAHVTEAAEPVTKRRPAIPVPLETVIMRCLAKRPADRWQTAAELHAALEPFGTPSVGITPTQTAPVRAVRGRPAIGWPPIAIVVGLLAVAALGWWRFGGARSGMTTHAIAVLPFDNVGHDTAYDYLADGIANDVRDGLVKLPGLAVKARTSSAAAKGRSVHDAGALLHVPVLLQGEFRRTADQVTVTVDLVKVSDETALWSHEFMLPADGNFAAAQDSITAAVATALGLGSAPGVRSASAQRGTKDAEAYDLYLKGQFFFAKRGGDNLYRSIGYFKQAIARDPDFARAYAGLSLTEGILPAYVQLRGDSILADAEQNARHALAIDSTLAAAHLALANALTSQLHPAEAEPEFRTAIALDPRNVTARQWHGDNLNVLGRSDEAISENRAATNLDPLSAVAYNDLSYSLVCAHRFDEAARAAQRALELDPTFVYSLMYLGEALAFMGKSDSTRVMVDRLFLADSLAPNVRAMHAWVLALGGDRAGTERQLGIIAADSSAGSHDIDLAIVDGALGRKAVALDALDRAVRSRSFYIAESAIGCDPLFSPLSDEPRMAAILKQAGQVACTGKVKWPIPPGPGEP